MSKQNPYFSFDGMAFKTPGDDEETAANTHMAMDILKRLVTEGGGQSEEMQALGYLEDQNPKLERYCDEMRIAFLLDDFDDADIKKRMANKVYNSIADRLSGLRRDDSAEAAGQRLAESGTGRRTAPSQLRI